ncbi:MAG: hypothetical protein HC809_17065 [Gammaproteobacteria bacterium]|nr:hypothetical protein [Gammaproteobacteria bacterium]
MATVAVDKLLVARADLSATVVFDLIEELVSLKPALMALNPAALKSLSGEFDASNLAFMLHSGAASWLRRDEPNLYERYSGVAEVLVTVLAGLVTGGFALVKIWQVRRKNRIDVFYRDALDIRVRARAQSTRADLQSSLAEICALQERAFELLIDEGVAADDSFRIFVSLTEDIVRTLESRITAS